MGELDVKEYPGVDYDFRPESYWGTPDPLSLIIRHVKGSSRRKLIIDHWKAGTLNDLDDSILKDTLTEAERLALARLHPTCMGGEYLSDFKACEEEIVRVQLHSTTADVISVRARPVSRGIAWSVIDEYPEEGEYIVKPKVTRRPPSLAELILLLDGVTYTGAVLVGGLALGWTNFNYGDGDSMDAEEVRDFTSVESRFYPQLPAHYGHVVDEWVTEKEQAGKKVPPGSALWRRRRGRVR